MNPRIEKLESELTRNTDKIARLKARNKVIAHKIKELRNTDIIGIFNELNMTPDELAAFAAKRKIVAARKGGEDDAN